MVKFFAVEEDKPKKLKAEAKEIKPKPKPVRRAQKPKNPFSNISDFHKYLIDMALAQYISAYRRYAVKRPNGKNAREVKEMEKIRELLK